MVKARMPFPAAPVRRREGFQGREAVDRLQLLLRREDGGRAVGREGEEEQDQAVQAVIFFGLKVR